MIKYEKNISKEKIEHSDFFEKLPTDFKDFVIKNPNGITFEETACFNLEKYGDCIFFRKIAGCNKDYNYDINKLTCLTLDECREEELMEKEIKVENLLVISLDVFGAPIYIYIGEGDFFGYILYELYEETIIVSDSFSSFFERLYEYKD